MTKTILALVAGVLTAGLLATSYPAAAAGGGRSAEIIHQFTLPSVSLTTFGYSVEEIRIAQANGLASTDHPAIASGLQRLNGNYFLSITDRGPNADRADGNKAFPLPQFTPTIVLFRAVHDRLLPEEILPIVNDLGQGITGLPNGPADDSTPYLSVTSTNPLPFNPDGMDVEDVHTLPRGGFILVEEYGPSVVIVGPDANVLTRYTPAGKKLPGARYTVNDSLPAIFRQRRANRGFEALAVSDNGRTAYTLTQSPMGSTSAGSPYRDSRLARVIRLDISDPLNLRVTGEFVFLMLPAADYGPGINQRDLKISAAAWVSSERLLLVQGADGAAAKIFLVDLTGATDVKDFASATTVPLVLEKVGTDLSALGITAGTTRLVLDLGAELPQIAERKLEGLSILNANEISITNDSDFGIGANPNEVSKLYTIRLPSPLR